MYRRDHDNKFGWKPIGVAGGIVKKTFHSAGRLAKRRRTPQFINPQIEPVGRPAGIPVVKVGLHRGIKRLAKQYDNTVWCTPSKIRATGIGPVSAREIENVIGNLIGVPERPETIADGRGRATMKRHRRNTLKRGCQQRRCLVTSPLKVMVLVLDWTNVKFARLADRCCLHMRCQDFHQHWCLRSLGRLGSEFK